MLLFLQYLDDSPCPVGYASRKLLDREKGILQQNVRNWLSYLVFRDLSVT